MSKALAYLFLGRGLHGGIPGALTWLAAKEIPDIHKALRSVTQTSVQSSYWGLVSGPIELLLQRLVDRERRATLPGDVTG